MKKNPSLRSKELDIFDPLNPNQPPYTQEYIKRYRQAQIDRNRKITQWCKKELKMVNSKLQSIQSGWEQNCKDKVFLIPCTQADIRRIDLSIDPNKRPTTTINELARENHSPVGVGRITTLRSFFVTVVL